MSELVIDFNVAKEAEMKNKPATIVISKMNIAFNVAATNLLALKKGDQFLLVMKDDVLYYKDVAKDGFQITVSDNKGAKLINRGLHIVLNEKFKKNEKSFRFEIGEFKDGTRILNYKD